MSAFVLRAHTVGEPDGGCREPHVYSFHVGKSITKTDSFSSYAATKAAILIEVWFD